MISRFTTLRVGLGILRVDKKCDKYFKSRHMDFSKAFFPTMEL